MGALFMFVHRMPFLAPTLDTAQLFALVIVPCLYLYNTVEVADQDPASECENLQ